MMHILLLGKNGQLGWELQRTLAPLGDVVALDYPEIDLTHPDGYTQNVRDARPDVIINATAYTAVDRAESEPEIAHAINGRAPGILAEIATDLRAAILHYSTDYVFDGAKGSPYIETDSPNPLNVYGESKLAGEKAIEQVDGAYLILRTSWVYSLRRESFVTKVLHWAREHEELRIVADQVSNPTWARMLAEITALLLTGAGKDTAEWIMARRGLYHLAGDGFASRYEWAKAILTYDPNREEQIAQKINIANTVDFPTPARRPLYSALDCNNFHQTFGLSLPHWEAALQMALN